MQTDRDDMVEAMDLIVSGVMDTIVAVYTWLDEEGKAPRTDIAGAQGVGMRAIRFTGVVDWTDDGQASADAEIASYSELEPLLGEWARKNGT